MKAEIIIYLLTLLLNLGIIGLVVYAIYTIVKMVKRHFAILTEIQRNIEGIRQQIEKNS